MKFYVYILYSPSLNIYYKGFSTDVEKRLKYHFNSEHKFTSKTRDWVIVYKQEFLEKSDALKEEKRLKKLNRKSIEKLIS
ncbi:GIY-YIG nuclease family protein [Kaistella sp. G5-32]|uniref:GIY-YIG nuclease family protein n=1 Tax=Kaistella gelatinilytica TaxID=2787636 RepID=A0ABS0F809_9FLAO|nr:GIY-YIG nuclease family protein [Kaistella gelatinilytica]